MGIYCMTTQGAQLGALCQPRGVDAVGGRREVQEEGDIWLPMVDSCWYRAETYIML